MMDRKQFADEIIPLLGKGKYVSYSELDRLREIVKQAFYEGYMDGAAYSGSHSMFFLWRHSESLGNLEEALDNGRQ